MGTKSRILVAVVTLVLVFGMSSSAHAQGAETIYKGKCAACHGADGTGSAMGKKMGVHDFHSPEVQKQSDADLIGAIANGKNKMPAYGKSLKTDDIQSLVTYIRTLGK
jgi:mono/diheme cytochrome c family protein